MKLIYFNNGSGLGTAKSGGTVRHIETARGLMVLGTGVYIVTTPGARDFTKTKTCVPRSSLLLKPAFLRIRK